MRDYASKAVVQQIGNKLNEKIQLIQQNQREQTEQLNQQVMSATDDNKSIIYEF